MIYEILAGAALLAFAAFWLLLHYLKKETAARAKAEHKNEQSEKVLDEIDTANAARDRLRSDPDYADKLRDKYTRK